MFNLMLLLIMVERISLINIMEIPLLEKGENIIKLNTHNGNITVEKQ